MVARFHFSQLARKIYEHESTNPTTTNSEYQSTRFFKLSDDNDRWYRLSVGIKKVDINDVDPTNKQASYNLENLLGQLMITNYQMIQLKERISSIVNGGTTKDAFMFKNNAGQWYNINIDTILANIDNDKINE